MNARNRKSLRRSLETHSKLAADWLADAAWYFDQRHRGLFSYDECRSKFYEYVACHRRNLATASIRLAELTAARIADRS